MAFPVASGEDALQLGDAAGHARFDGANWNVEDFRDFCDANGYRISGEHRRYEDCTNFLAEPK